MKTLEDYNRDWNFPEGQWPQDFLESITKTFEQEINQPSGLDSYEGIFKSPLMFLLQRRRELEKMIQLARQIKPEIVFTIGSDKGGDVFHWVKCLPSVRKVIACEIRGCPYRHLFEKHFPDKSFLWIERSSYCQETQVEVAKFLNGEKIDVLFIDGEKVRFVDDFDAYHSMMRNGGIVFTHDVQDEAPGNAFRTLIERGFRNETIIDTLESAEAMDRERMGQKADCPYEDWLRTWGGRSCGVGVIYV